MPVSDAAAAILHNTIVVLRAGDAVAPVAARRGEFSAWIREGIGDAWSGDYLEVDVRTAAPSPDLLAAAGLIVTGSSSSVTERAPWMLATEHFLRAAIEANVPLLGICFGHQLLAQALGGEVAKNPRGREIGTVEVRASSEDPLLDGLEKAFRINATHVDTVLVKPSSIRVLAQTSLEDVAAFAIENARGVQFHPEIDGDAMRGYLDARRPILVTEGFDVDAMIEVAVDTPAGPRILKNFVNHFVLPRRAQKSASA